MSPARGRKVVVVARGLPDAGDPLLGIFELDQARALAAAGHDVVVVALDVRSVRRRRRLGVHVTLVNGPQPLRAVVCSLPVGAVGDVATARVLRLAWRLARRRLRRHWGEPDVVHAHFARFGLATRRGRGDRYGHVVTEHSSVLDGGDLAVGVEQVVRGAYAAADRVLAVSPHLVGVLRDRFGVAAAYVPDVVDVDLFDRPRRPRAAGEPARLLSVGNLVPRKRMGLLLDAYAAARLDATLTVVGDGPERAALEARTPPGVALVGARDREAVAGLLAATDGFVLLSRHETFGVVYAEAMAAGVPVLSSRCGGPEGFVTPDVGRFTDATDPSRVAADLAAFVAGLDRYDPAAVRAAAVAQFAPAVVAARLTEVYAEVAPPA